MRVRLVGCQPTKGAREEKDESQRVVSSPDSLGGDGARPGSATLEECEHMFLSESRETAFQEALRIGREEEYALVGEEGSPEIECRLAEVVYLESLGSDVARFEVQLGEKPARERISFDYIFQPEARMPPPPF